MDKKITIIGGGNLGKSLLQGLLDNGHNPSNLTITRRNISLLEAFSKQGVKTTSNNIEAVQNADLVILAIKPKTTKSILQEINASLNENTLLLSFVSAYKIKDIDKHINTTKHIFRVMPNTALSVQDSMTCISANGTSDENINIVLELFNQLGETLFIDEELMDASTVLGACGIAYALRFIRAMTQGGIEIGFSSKDAQKIATQTLKGASEIILKNGTHPEEEIDKVTTPQGCTIAGLNEMEHQGFSSSLISGIITSYKSLKD